MHLNSKGGIVMKKRRIVTQLQLNITIPVPLLGKYFEY
jgi:hypothetical protein